MQHWQPNAILCAAKARVQWQDGSVQLPLNSK